MSKFCPHCGKSLKEGYEFCIECGKPVYQDNTNKDIRSIGSQQKLKVDKKEKKESNYILNSSQRKILISKIFPILLFGSIIWLTSELIFSYFFSDFQYNSQFLIFYISMIVIDALLFVILYFVSKANKIVLGIIIFFSFSFIAGILSLPIVIFTEFLPQVHMFVSLSRS